MKKKAVTLLMGTSLVMGLAACGGGSDTSKNQMVVALHKAGTLKRLYDQKCSSCHGGNLKGAVGPNLTKDWIKIFKG